MLLVEFIDTLIILNIAASSAVVPNFFNAYDYVTTSQDLTYTYNINNHSIDSADRENMANTNTTHESLNRGDSIMVGYWTGFFGLGSFISGLIIYRWIGYDDINRMRLLRYFLC